jgi:hypothetical protein
MFEEGASLRCDWFLRRTSESTSLPTLTNHHCRYKIFTGTSSTQGTKNIHHQLQSPVKPS